MKKAVKYAFILYCIWLIYTFCTISGQMKFQALLISNNPLVYFMKIQSSDFNPHYYSFKNEVYDSETGNPLADFKCKRTGPFTYCEYIGFS